MVRAVWGRTSWVLSFLACVVALGCDSGGDGSGDGGNEPAEPADNDASTGEHDGGSGAGGTSAGTGGTSGTSSSGGSGGSGGTGGDDEPDSGMTMMGEPGPGIPTDGDVFCLKEATDTASAFYFGVHKTCLIYKGKSGPLTEQERASTEGSCSALFGGKVVDECPDEPVAAYCAGTPLVIGGVQTDGTQLVYESEVNPNGPAVARNAIQICPGMNVYDSDDTALVAKCTGTFTADIDGEPHDFSENLICQYRTDGTRAAYFVRGAEDHQSVDSKELSIRLVDDGSGAMFFVEVNQPAYGYLEGSTAAGAFAWPVMGDPSSFEASSYDADGAGITATFELGRVSTSPTGADNTREITAGVLDIEFAIE